MMRREHGPAVGGGRVDGAAEVRQARPQRDDHGQTPLEAARRANTEACPHEEPQIESADVDEQSFQDVRVTPQMRPTQTTGLIEMRIRPFQVLRCVAAARPARAQPRMRRRFAYTASRAGAFFFQRRRPRSGSAM